MKCSYCGNELPNGASFCPECGTIMNLDNDFVPPAAPEAPEMPPEPQMQPTQLPPQEEFAVPVYVSPYTAPEVFAQQPEPQTPAPEPAETVVTPTEEVADYDEDDDGDDMIVDGGGKKRGKGAIIAILVVLLAAVAAYGVKTFVLDKRPATTAAPTETPTSETSTEDIFWTVSTEADDTTDDTDDTDDTDVTDDTDDLDDTDDTDDTDDIDDSDLTDPNEFTAPSEFDSTTAPTITRESTTRESTTRTTTTTTRHTTTTTRHTTTTTRPRVTTTRPTTTAAPTTTVQKPHTTTPRKTLYVTTNGVALRTAPSKSASSLLSLSVGADVVVTGEENGYYYVYSNRYGVSGWASKAYIGDSRPVATSEQQVSGVVGPDVTYSSPKSKSVSCDGSSLNLRKGPGTSYGVIRSISDGYPVLVKGASDSVAGWVYVTDITHGVSGWVSASYLK